MLKALDDMEIFNLFSFTFYFLPLRTLSILFFFIDQCSLALFIAIDNKVSHTVKQKKPQIERLLGDEMFVLLK